MKIESNTTSYRWIILSISSLLVMLLFMTQIIWAIEIGAPEVEPGDIQEAFGRIGYSSAMLGFSLLVLSQGIGNLFQGILVHRIGFRKTFLTFIPLFIVPQFLIPFLPQLITNSAYAWYVCLLFRIIQGTGIVFGVLSPLVGSWFPQRERGLAQGIFMAAIAINTGIGACLVGGLTKLGYGWEYKFFILGILVVIFSVLWLFLVKEPPVEKQTKQSVANKEYPIKSKQKIYLLPSTWLVVGIISTNCWVLFGIVGNAAPYLSDIGYSKPLQKSLALLLLSLSGVIATPLGGKVSDFLIDKLGLIKARATSLMFGFAFVSILAVAFPWTATLGYSLALIAIFLVGFGGPWTSGIAWALPTDLDAKNAGTLSGIALIVGQSVGSLSSYLVAQIASLSTEYAWEWAYLVLGIGSMVGIVPCYFLKKIVRRHEDE